MDATVEQLGGVVIDALRAVGYFESTIGQYEKTIRYLSGFVTDRGEAVYTPSLGLSWVKWLSAWGPGSVALRGSLLRGGRVGVGWSW